MTGDCYKCKYCEKSFSRRTGYKSHLSTENHKTKEKAYYESAKSIIINKKCSICGVVLITLYEKLTHSPLCGYESEEAYNYRFREVSAEEEKESIEETIQFINDLLD